MASKATRRHSVFSIESYKKLPESITEIANNCKDHDMKFTNFCQQHNALCCPACILSSHKTCLERVVLLQDMIGASKTSASLENIEQCCNDLQTTISKVIDDRKQNLLEVENQRKTIQIEIEQMRLKLNLHLDRLEKDIISKLLAAEAEIKSQIETLLTQLSLEASTINELHRNVMVVKEFASDLQTFLSVKSIEDKIEEKEKFVRSLTEKRNLQRLNLTYHINEELSDILSTITIFGSVSIDTSPGTIHLTKDKQAQIMAVIPHPTKCISDIAFTLHSTISIPERFTYRYTKIRGCTVCPEMTIALTDSLHGELVIRNDDGAKDKVIFCCDEYNGPQDVTSIDDQTVAVTTSSAIKIINTKTKQTTRTITTSGPCCGITYHEGALLWCESYKGIQMLQLSDQKVTTVVKEDTWKDWAYITTCGDKIYQTDYHNSTVICFTIKGEKLWEYKDESVVKYPTGVAVDNNYNVYVTSSDTDSVVVLSPDGKQSRTLLGKEQRLEEPWAIHYDRKRNKLIVCNANGFLYVYDISF